jgi:hypothetical protein
MLQAGNVPKKSNCKIYAPEAALNLSAILLSRSWAEPLGYYAPLTLVRSSLTLSPASLAKNTNEKKEKSHRGP